MDILQRFFKSVSGKARIDILLLLLDKGELCAGDIASFLNCKINTVSQNIRLLEKDNFVKVYHAPKKCLLFHQERFKMQA